MGDADGGTTGPAGRWVSVRLQHRHVRMDDQECPEECASGCGEEELDGVVDGLSMSYPGIIISNYDEDRLVGERWIPLGVEPTEEDDEVLIEQLRAAMLWQARRPPQETTGE